MLTEVVIDRCQQILKSGNKMCYVNHDSVLR